MSASHFILLIESDPDRTETLATHLVRLGVEPIRVADLAEAVATVKSNAYGIAAIVLPADLPGRFGAQSHEEHAPAGADSSGDGLWQSAGQRGREGPPQSRRSALALGWLRRRRPPASN